MKRENSRAYFGRTAAHQFKDLFFQVRLSSSAIQFFSPCFAIPFFFLLILILKQEMRGEKTQSLKRQNNTENTKKSATRHCKRVISHASMRNKGKSHMQDIQMMIHDVFLSQETCSWNLRQRVPDVDVDPTALLAASTSFESADRYVNFFSDLIFADLRARCLSEAEEGKRFVARCLSVDEKFDVVLIKGKFKYNQGDKEHVRVTCRIVHLI